MLAIRTAHLALILLAIALGLTACARADHAGSGRAAPQPPIVLPTPAAGDQVTAEAVPVPSTTAPRAHQAQARMVHDAQGHPLAARDGEHEVLAAEDGPADAQGRFTRVRLVRRDGLKYPLIRQIEQMQRGPHGEASRIALHEAVADHLQVTVHDPATRALLAKALPAGCAIRRVIPGAPVVLVSIPAATHDDYPAALAALAAMPGVAHAGSDWLVHAAITPNDPSFAQQWALDNQGQDGGTVDADIDAPEAWAYHTGSRSVKVGVIDTGIDIQHPDLVDNLWTNPGEIAGNGLDDDGNGYVDDVTGWNFVGDNANPDDDHFHGTHVAGTIGASTGNGTGVAGVCWQVTLVPLKFLDANGSGYTSDAVAAIYYASAIGCDLTNNSWGGGGFDPTLKDAIDAAGAQGQLFIAAAGNNGSDLAAYPSYPASYACANLVAVAATDRNDTLASFSNYNATAVHIAAPGVAILSTFPTQQTAAMASRGLSAGYGSISGTSMATPHVSGALALLAAAEPGLSAADRRARLLQRCDAISALIGKVAGARRLNLRHLLDPAWTAPPAQVALNATAMSEVQGDQDGFPGPGETIRLIPSFVNLGGVDTGACTITAQAASAGVSVLAPTSGTVAGMPPLATVSGPAYSLQLDAGLADGQTIAVDFVVTGAAGSLGTFRWSGTVAAPPPRAEVATTFAVGEMVADPVRPLVYVIDKTMPAILAISTETGRLVGRVPLAGSSKLDPPATNGSLTSGLPAVSADGNTLYVCLPRAGLIQCLSLPQFQTIRTITCQGWLPFSAAGGPDGSLYVSSRDNWGPIRRLDPVSGAIIGTFTGGLWGDFYMHALLRTNADHTRLFVSETGLRVEGGPGYAHEYDISGPTPVQVKSHPFQMVYLSDYAIDEAGGRILTTCGGIYGIQLTNMASGAYGTVWPFGYPYGTGVRLLPGDDRVYGSSGGPYDATICRFNLATGSKTANYPLSKGSSYTLPPRGFALASDRRMVYTLMEWRGDGLGYEGYNFKLGIIGCGTLTLNNHPRALATLTPLSGAPGLTVTGNATAAYDPDAGGGITAYRWDFGDGATATTAIASHTYPTRGSYTVTLDVTDIEGLVDRTSFTVVVNGPPVPQAQSVTTPEDTAKAIVLSASDPEGDAITYTIVSYPSKGSLSGTVPNLTYTPYSNQNGSDAFTFRASDGLSSATATVSISITPVNDPPVASDRSILTKLNTAVAVSIAATDPDSPSLIYQITQAPVSGVLSGTAPNLTYTPTAGFAGLDTLRFTASDGMVTTAPATVTIRVNRPPVADPVSVAVAYETAKAFVLSGSDPDGQALTFRVTASPIRGTITGTAPNLTYTPKTGETGTDTLTFVANDGYHDSAPATVTFTITAVNPWAEADLAQAPTAGSVLFTPTGTVFTVRGSGDLGPVGDGGRFTWTTLPADGLLVARVGAITGGRGGLMLRSSVAADAACAALVLEAGQLSLIVRTGDGLPATTTALGAQAAPCWLRLQRTPTGIDAARSSDGKTWTQLAAAELTLPEPALAGLWAGSSDASLAQLTADQVRTHHSINRTWQTFGASPARTGVVTGAFAATPFSQIWQAAPGGDLQPVAVGNGLVFATKYIYSTTAWIKALDLATGAERWQVTTPSSYSVNPAAFAEGRVFVQRSNNYNDTHLWCVSAATGTVLWKAPFGSQWERYMAGCPANGMIYVNGGTYGGMYGFDQVDGAQRFFNSTLGQVDQWAPAFADGQLYSWVGGKARGHDPLSGVTTWTLDLLNDGRGTVPVVAGTSLVLRGSGALHVVDTSTRTKRWSVNAIVAGTPAVSADTVYALVGSQLHAYALSSGTFLRSFTATGTLLGQPLVTDDAILVASSASTWILDRSTFAVRQTLDIGGHLALIERTLVVANASGIIRAYAAPIVSADLVATPQTVDATEDTAAAITLTGSGPAGRPLTFQVVTPPQHGTLSGNPPALSYLPQGNYAGSDSFVFAVRDGIYTSAPATVAIVVAPVNDPPVLTPRTIALGQDGSASFTATVTDIDSPIVTLALALTPLHGQVVINGLQLTYTPTPGYAGNDRFRLTASDGQAVSSEQQFDVAVFPPSDKLVAPNAAAGQQFGLAVSIAGDWAAVGAPRVGRGQVHLYRRVTGGWLFHSTIPADAETTNDWFGVSVALAGDTLAVGSCNAASAGVTLFTRTAGDVWVRQGMYASAYGASTVLAENEVLGYAGGAWVALDGDLLALGAPLDGYGAVTIYRRNAIGQWQYDTKISGTASTLRFGWGVALSGSRLAVGAHRANGTTTACGAVLAYERLPAGWSAAQLIRPDDVVANDWFGYAVAMDGDRLVVGAPQHDLGGTDAGAVWVYAASAGTWTLQAKLANSDVDPAWDQLGKAVAISGDRVVAGAPYAWSDGVGATGRITSWLAESGGWTLESRRITFDAADQDWITEQLDLDGDHAIVGVPLDDDAGSSSGSAYVLTYLPRSSPPVALDGAATTSEDLSVGLTLDGTDPDGDALTIEVVSGPAHGSLAGDGASRTYVPEPDWSGIDTVVFRVSDGNQWSGPATVTITVQAVNDRPSILAGPDQVADGDGRAVAVPAWIAAFIAGPADEAGQTASYTVTTDRTDLFDVQPAVAADGGLTFTPSMDAEGTAILTITCQDDGGTALGGIDTSLPVTARIDVLARWDADLEVKPITAVALVASDTQATEAGDPGRLTLTRSGPTTADLQVDLSWGSSNTAINGTDFAFIATSVTIPAGQASYDIVFTPLQDVLSEGNESLTLIVSPSAAYYQLPGTVQTATVTLVDDDPVTVNVGTSDATMTEPSNHGGFTLTRTGSPAEALTVQLATFGTATSGADYAPLPAVVIIPAGAASVAIPATTIDDADAEERETVILAVQPGAGYAPGSVPKATATISDDEAEAVGIEVISGPAAEPGIVGTFRVFRRGSSAASRTLTYTVSGTATSGSDYTALSGTVTLAANVSSANLTITPKNDSLVEDAETVVITLGAPSGVGVIADSASLTILDNDGTVRPVVSLKAGIAKGGEPATAPTFIISRTGATTASLRVLLQPATGGAIAAADYAALPLVVDIPAGAASLTLPVDVIDDAVSETSETITLALAASADYSVSTTRSATVTITDDDAQVVNIAPSDLTAAEPGTDTGSWTVSRTGSLSQPLTVLLASRGTATAGSDYTSLPAQVTLPAGSSQVSIALTALPDDEAEADEQAILEIQPDPAYSIFFTGTPAVTIKDDETPLIDLTAIDSAATEGGDTGKFRITRRGKASAALTIPLAWSGTAQNGIDVNTLPASATLAANAISLDITVTVKQDTAIEAVETMIGTLQPGTGFALGQSQATVRITDDEAGGAVAIRMVDASGYEFDAAPATIEVFRTGRLTTAITVPYTLAGTAIVREHTTPRQVVLPIGVDCIRMQVTPIRDVRVESDETVILRLLGGTGYALGTGAEGTFTIIEAPPGSG